MQRFKRTDTQMFFDRRIEPIGSIRPGEAFVVETADAVCGVIKSERDTFRSFNDLLERLGGACPVTGPIFVEGAWAGDCLAVTIEDMKAAPVTGTGWTTIVPGWGGLTQDMGYSIQDPLPPRSVICDVGPEHIRMELDGRDHSLPVEPFLGTVGVAPADERRMTLSQSREYLGDVDLRAVGAGSTLFLPVNVDGALLSMGDAHAAQGEGEITGIAVEVEADVTLRVKVLSREEAGYGRFPMLETEDWVGVIVGQMGVSLTSCVRAGYVDLCQRLQRYHGLSREGAYILLGQVGRVRIGNMIDPFYSCLVSISRRYLG